MQDQKYSELETRASELMNAESAARERDEIRKLEARMRVHQEIQRMKEEGKALVLTEEEEGLLHSFRRFKLRMRKDGEVFTWQTRRPDSVQLVEDTAEIFHPSEAIAE